MIPARNLPKKFGRKGVVVRGALVMAWKQKIWNGVVWFSKELHGFIKGLFVIWLVFVIISLIVMGVRHITDAPTKSPEVIIRDYYEAIENEDFETVKKLFPVGGKDEEMGRKNEESQRKEMARWAEGFREEGGLKSVSRTRTSRIKIDSMRDEIKFLGITVWTKYYRTAEMDFHLYVRNGFYIPEEGIALSCDLLDIIAYADLRK